MCESIVAAFVLFMIVVSGYLLIYSSLRKQAEAQEISRRFFLIQSVFEEGGQAEPVFVENFQGKLGEILKPPLPEKFRDLKIDSRVICSIRQSLATIELSGGTAEADHSHGGSDRHRKNACSLSRLLDY